MTNRATEETTTGNIYSRALRAFNRLFLERTYVLLIVVSCFNIAITLWYLDYRQSKLVVTGALNNAALYSESIAEFRALYTSEVVERAMQSGLEVTHDYLTRDNAIPLPATLSVILGERIGARNSGAFTRLFSPYPFPWREADGGLVDSFSVDAWRELTENPDKPFYRFEKFDGIESIRYAVADRMIEQCVNCHNTHPDTPKDNWKVGDVRGVLEVIMPLEEAIAQARTGIKDFLLLLSLLTLFGVGGVLLVIHKLKRASSETKKFAEEIYRTNIELKSEMDRRMRVEKDATQNEVKLAEAQRIAQIGSWRFDLRTRALWWSDELYRQLGYQPGEITPNHVKFLRNVHPDDYHLILEKIKERYRSSAPVEFDIRYVMPDKSIKIFRINAKFELNSRGSPIRMVGTAQNITEKVQIERDLQLTKFSVDNAGDAAFWIAPDAKFLYVNNSACRQLGYSREEFLSMSVFDIDPEFSSDKWFEHWEEIKKRGSFMIESMHKKKNGEKFPVEVQVNYLKYENKEYNFAFVRDLTERKRAEEETSKREKLESIGILAGGIAHDFNNMLTGILGHISLAKFDTVEETEIHDNLELAESVTYKAKELTQQLLTFSRGGSPIKRITEIKQLLIETVTFALRGSNVRYEIKCDDNLLAANIDPGQINQAIHNLVLNASQAMPDGGTITVTATNAAIQDSNKSELAPGKYVHIIVTDEGFGIPEDCLQKIYDPYFTTKKTGSGLGLANVFSVIKNHGGYIDVTSVVNEGTTFELYLPAAEVEVEVATDTGKIQVLSKGRVLVMDDEKFITDLATRILGRFGHTVIVTHDGYDAALEYKRALESDEPYDVVLLDLTVPGHMGGLEAVTELIRIDPNVKAIVCSGYSNDPVMSNYEEYGFAGAVSKPYKPKELALAVGKLIGSTSSIRVQSDTKSETTRIL